MDDVKRAERCRGVDTAVEAPKAISGFVVHWGKGAVGHKRLLSTMITFVPYYGETHVFCFKMLETPTAASGLAVSCKGTAERNKRMQAEGVA